MKTITYTCDHCGNTASELLVLSLSEITGVGFFKQVTEIKELELCPVCYNNLINIFNKTY